MSTNSPIQSSMTHSSTLTAAAPSKRPNPQAWHRPIVSPEHGVYVMLLVAFLSGAAAAHAWTWATTLALIMAYCGFQAEHPWMLQLKQRKSLKPRFWVWGSFYSIVAVTIAGYLLWTQPGFRSSLIWIYLGAVAAFIMDTISVFQREQKSVLNELTTFVAVCLSAPLAYGVTTGTISNTALGLWLLNSVFFSSAIFTVKFRKDKAHAVLPSVLYHAIATELILGLWFLGYLPIATACAFGLALLKFGVILWQRTWYCTTKIQFVALLESGTALLFLMGVALSVLPARLS